MQVNYKILEHHVREFLSGPGGKEVVGEVENSVLFNVIASLCLLPIALLLVLSIIGAKIGIPLTQAIVWSFMTGEIFKSEQAELLKNLDRLKAIVVAPIIVGPSGHGLVLGCASRKVGSDLDWLAKKANEFASLYTGDMVPVSAEDHAMLALLRDDNYIPSRRRQVPKAFSDGTTLFMFDIEIDQSKLIMSSSQQTYLLCALTVDKPIDGKPRGTLVQLPGQLAIPALSQ